MSCSKGFLSKLFWGNAKQPQTSQMPTQTVKMDQDELNVSDDYSLILSAIRRKAEVIDVQGDIEGHFCPLPNDLFTCQSLVNLKLRGWFMFNVTNPVHLPNLKTISISDCKFSNANSAKRLFSSCPVLADLFFSFCEISDSNVISISIPSLKRLTIACGYTRRYKVELNNVPNLETIRLSGNIKTTKWYSVKVLKSLRHAHIVIVHGEDNDMIRELLHKFAEVQSLSFKGNWIESFARDSFSLPLFNKLTTLELTCHFSHIGRIFPILLGRSSCLERLTIDRNEFFDSNEEFLEFNILLPPQIPLCFSRSLKEVQLRMFEGLKIEYEWLGYLLKNVQVLEKLVVSARLVDEGEKDSAYLEKVTKNLLALPRDSKNCQIVVTENRYKPYKLLEANDKTK